MNFTLAPFSPLERRAFTGLILVAGVVIKGDLVGWGLEEGALADMSTLCGGESG